ncbi:MAG: PEP-CTERM sorting domain-containing protein [Pseudomonadota bacterium]
MKRNAISIIAGALLGLSSGIANALLINPSDDGSIYSSGIVSNSAYLMASGSIQAVVEFSLNGVGGSVSSAQLSLNPYGLPLWDKTVDIYGYSSNDGILTSLDYNAGTLLGSLTLSDSLVHGQDSFFDVKDFINSVSSGYVGFNLRTTDTDVFSSIEYNYGHSAQLNVANVAVPEPSILAIMLLGLSGIFIARAKKA